MLCAWMGDWIIMLFDDSDEAILAAFARHPHFGQQAVEQLIPDAFTPAD